MRGDSLRSFTFCLSGLVGLILVSLSSGALADTVREANGPDHQKIALPQGVAPDWWSTVQKNLWADEYRPSRQKHDSKGKPLAVESWHLANRKQNLRAYIAEDGSWLMGPRDRSNGEHDWRWTYQFQGILRGNGKQAVTSSRGSRVSPMTASSQDRVVVTREAGVTEWYENSPEGIEQSFEISKRPLPESTGPVVLIGKVKTDLIVNSHSKDQITFSSDRRNELRYDHLVVRDATGRELPSWLEWRGARSELAINVDDAGAKYPIVIDPLSTSPAWMTESDQVGGLYGYSVATAGDVNGDGYSDVIVGAPRYDNGELDEGRAYVYHGSALGLSTTPAWTTESDQIFALYGTAVTTAGDVNGDGYSDVIVGASFFSNGENSEGRTYVYHGSASGLSSTPDWTTESNQVGAEYGTSVGTAGDVNGDGYSDVIIGAYRFDNGESEEGRAYVYHGSASGLSTTPDWTTESNQADAAYGISIGTAGDVNGDGYSDVIVGAWQYDNGENDEGRAYVYHGSALGLSTTPDWTAEPDLAGAGYGISVGTAGDVNGDGYSDVIVGAWLYDNGQNDEGRAYVYHGSASGLSTTPAWTTESDQADAYYGFAVAAAGDINGDGYSEVVIGAKAYDNGETDEGRAYVYEGSASGLSTTPAWTTEADLNYANYGFSVGTAGDVDGDGFSDLIVGSVFHTNGQNNEGGAFVYNGSASGLSMTPAWTTDSDENSAHYGSSVATAGDVNGDGYSDVIVGAPYYDNGQNNEGTAYVYLGSALGLSTTPAWTTESNQANAAYGYSVASAGDVNGDGYSDVIVGSSFYDNGQLDEGRAYVYHGSASGLATTSAWTAESDQADAYYGSSVATAGDVNGDGYSDVIVGAPYYDNGQNDEGRAYVYRGSASGLSTTAAWTTETDQADAYYGNSVSTAGDVNGDGYSDVIVGAYSYDNGETDEGGAFVYHGSASGLATTAAWTTESDQALASYGYSVSIAGDVNGDGYSDVIVGSSAYDNGQVDEGRADVYHGSASGLSITPAWTTESDQVGASYGNSVATAGDVNGDGYSDVIVGAYGYDNGESDEGRAFVYHGSASGLSTTPAWTTESDQTNAFYGNSVASAGDVNGDGYSDVIVGAFQYTSFGGAEGRAYIYFGNNGSALAIHPQQLNSASEGMQVLGRTEATSFNFVLRSRVPVGRTRARLIWEVKPLGTSFNGAGLGKASSFTDTTVSGVDLSQMVSSLSDLTNYHWRARIQYFPLMNYSPWFSTGNNGANESDFRVIVATSTPTYTPTSTPTPTATSTATNTPTLTATSTATNTPTPTATSTATNTPTPTATGTATNTPTPTVTITPTIPATATASPTIASTPTTVPIASPTPLPTSAPNQISGVVLANGVPLQGAMVYVADLGMAISNEHGHFSMQGAGFGTSYLLLVERSGVTFEAASMNVRGGQTLTINGSRATFNSRQCVATDIAANIFLAGDAAHKLYSAAIKTVSLVPNAAPQIARIVRQLNAYLVASRALPEITLNCAAIAGCTVSSNTLDRQTMLQRVKNLRHEALLANKLVRLGNIRTLTASNLFIRKIRKLHLLASEAVNALPASTESCD